jgi:hypothetical protein
MSLAELVIVSVKVEGRSKSEVARDCKVSRYWVQQLVKRYEAEGERAFQPRSRRPRSNPRAISLDVEDRIVRLRKNLSRKGLDAGAETIRTYLQVAGVDPVPSVAGRSNGSTRPRRSGSPPSRPPPPSATSNASSTGSAATTTPSGPTAPSAASRPDPSPPRRNPRSRCTTASAATRPTPAAPSPCATAAGTTTSAWAREHARTRVRILVANRCTGVVHADTGELLRELTLDPRRDYQPLGRTPGRRPRTR